MGDDMKKIVILSLLIVSLTSFASDEDRWVYLSQHSDGVDTYYDAKTIHKKKIGNRNFVDVWVKTIPDRCYTKPDGNTCYTIAKHKFDCENRRWAVTNLAVIDLMSHKKLSIFNSEPDYTDIYPESEIEFVFSKFCNGKIS